MTTTKGPVLAETGSSKAGLIVHDVVVGHQPSRREVNQQVARLFIHNQPVVKYLADLRAVSLDPAARNVFFSNKRK
jgi:hypothetical protein